MARAWLDLFMEVRYIQDIKQEVGDDLRPLSAVYQILIFHQMIALKNYEKCFLFPLKSSFCSQDIQIFLFQSSPLFLPVTLCFRG